MARELHVERDLAPRIEHPQETDYDRWIAYLRLTTSRGVELRELDWKKPGYGPQAITRGKWLKENGA